MTVVVAAIAACASVTLRLANYSKQEPRRCVAVGDGATVYNLTTDQASIATTIAASAKRLGLPDHAVTVALATALQESGLRNLAHGDRDSVGVFQQRPSKGWGTRQQLQTPMFAATAFFASLVHVPRWQTAPVNDAAQMVQASAFPHAYGKWEPEARALARDLTGEIPAGLSCSVGAEHTFLDERARQAMQDELGTGGSPVVGGPNGWTVATWLVAHAAKYSVHAISYAGYRWSAKTATWRFTGGTSGAVTFS